MKVQIRLGHFFNKGICVFNHWSRLLDYPGVEQNFHAQHDAKSNT
jgi:hypothetical protein